MTESDQVRDRTFATAADAAAFVERQYADVGVEVVHSRESDEWWTECSDQLAQGDAVPSLIQWTTTWTFVFRSQRETASILDEVGQRYTGDGWERGKEINADGGGTSVPYRKDGYTMYWSGTGADQDVVPSIGLMASGPCIPAPQDIRDWEPTP